MTRDGCVDFGDQIGEPADGYGCMQVHNYTAAQTIFSINNWRQGGNGAELGIGVMTSGGGGCGRRGTGRISFGIGTRHC